MGQRPDMPVYILTGNLNPDTPKNNCQRKLVGEDGSQCLDIERDLDVEFEIDTWWGAIHGKIHTGIMEISFHAKFTLW